MLTIIIVAVCFFLYSRLLLLLTDSIWWQCVLMLLHYMTVSALRANGTLFWEESRVSHFARLVKWLFPVHFDAASIEQLNELAKSKRQLMFCLAPHGPLCLHAAIGFLGHVGELPKAMCQRLRLVGHWSLFMIPIVNELATAFGVIDSSRATVDMALENNQHVALIPCGMDSKIRVLIEAPVADKQTVVIHRSRAQFGFLVLAARRKALIVPVLGPDENNLYDLYGTRFGCWILTLIVGRFGVLPRQTSLVRVGKPIDTSGFASWKRADMLRLAELYYAALDELAGESHQLEFRMID
jgi:hypothetical protein